MSNLLERKPWLLVIAAFALLIGGWITILVIGSRNTPEPFPLTNPPAPEQATQDAGG